MFLSVLLYSVCDTVLTNMKTDTVRRSVSLSAAMAKKIDSIAASRSVTVDRAIIDLLADAITAYEKEREAEEPSEAERLRAQLGRMK